MKTFFPRPIPQWGLVSAVLCLLLPFADKAFHMDDPLFVWTARQIRSHPFDFYGFSLNWNGLYEPAHRIIQNPPLNGYLIAAAAAFTGENELAVHAWLSVAAVAAVLGVFRLARQVNAPPDWTALFMAATPVFWISATGAMADVPLLAFYVWALALWIEAVDGDRPGRALLSGILAAMACLTKYFGLTLVPLMAAYALAAGKFSPRRLAALLLPLAAIAGYQMLTVSLYDRALFSDAASYALGFAPHATDLAQRTFEGLSFAGGSLFGLVFAAPLIHRKKTLAAGAAAAAIILFLLLRPESAKILNLDALARRPALVRLQFWGFVLAGIYVIGLSTVGALRRGGPAALVLLLTVYGTFVFAAYLNWTVNARTMLPMAPAAAALVFSGAAPKAGSAPASSASAALALALALLAAVPFCLADYRLAGIQKRAAADLHRRLEDYPGRVWFQGHWGFQYYMQRFGSRPLDFSGTVLRAGDAVVVPSNNTLTTALAPAAYHLAGTLRYEGLPWAATMSPSMGAGFYAAQWGPLPFAIGPAPPQRFSVYLAGRFKDPASAVAPLARLLSEPPK